MQLRVRDLFLNVELNGFAVMIELKLEIELLSSVTLTVGAVRLLSGDFPALCNAFINKFFDFFKFFCEEFAEEYFLRAYKVFGIFVLIISCSGY